MNEFRTHLRKDAKLLTSDPLLIILIVMLIALSLVFALISTTSYISNMEDSGSVVTQGFMDEEQTRALITYWYYIGQMFMPLFGAVAAMAMSVEKGSEMSKYVLTLKVRKPLFYLSKLVVLTIMSLVALAIALVMYLLMFSVMDVPILDAETLAKSMLFPLLSMLVFASFGLALSTQASKKGAAIGMAMAFYIVLSILLPLTIMGAQDAARDAHPDIDSWDIPAEYYPLEYKLIIYGNPVVLSYGTSYIFNDPSDEQNALFDITEGVMLGVGFIVLFTFLGLLSFSRERVERKLTSQASNRSGGSEGPEQLGQS